MTIVSRPTNNKSGFSLTEVVVASFILLLATTVALSGFMYSLKNVNQSDTQSQLDMDVQVAIEMLKQDMRLSSMSLVSYYPATPPYKALSFPIAYDTDGDGMLQRDNKKIIWNETVIYHIRQGTPNELVRTAFSPRDNSMDKAARADQLAAVVKTGGSDNASSRSIFQNLLNWQLDPRAGRFNGYETYSTYEENVFLGYALLDNGDHEITFETVDPGDGGGYAMGIDQLMASPASTANEGEALTAQSQAGASTLVRHDRAAKNNHFLSFPATQKGNKFTVKVHNDKWVETNFENFSTIESVEKVYDENLTPKDIVLKLSGMETAWEASQQTGSPTFGTPGIDLKGAAVRQLLKGDSIANGSFIEAEGDRCRLIFRASSAQAFKITSVYFGESASDETINMGYRYTPSAIKFGGTEATDVTIPAGNTVTSTWTDVSISYTNNYLISYKIANVLDKDSPAIWPNYNSSTNPVLATTRLAVVGSGATYTTAQLAKEPANWDNLSDTNGLTISSLSYGIGLEGIQVCYAPTGTFTSAILDTTLSSPSFEGFTRNEEVPSGTSLNYKVRTGNSPDLSDATDWDLILPSSHIIASSKRYLQFQAIFKSDTDQIETPVLKDVTFNWVGQTRMVNIGGTFSKGPDHGVFEVSVDGEKLTSALIIDMDIYKDIPSMNGEMRRINSSQKVEISPRNTGF